MPDLQPRHHSVLQLVEECQHSLYLRLQIKTLRLKLWTWTVLTRELDVPYNPHRLVQNGLPVTQPEVMEKPEVQLLHKYFHQKDYKYNKSYRFFHLL